MFSSDDFKEYRKKLGFSSKSEFKNFWGCIRLAVMIDCKNEDNTL